MRIFRNRRGGIFLLLYSTRSQYALFDAPFWLQLRQAQKKCSTARKAPARIRFAQRATTLFFRLPRFAKKCAVKNAHILTALSIVSKTVFSVAPLRLAAEHYFVGGDYPQAMQLWNEILRLEKGSLSAVLVLSELKLMLESRTASRDLLVRFMEGKENLIDAESKTAIKDRLSRIAATFVTEQGQALFLQARQKTRRGEWEGALSLLDQAAGVEKGNIVVLREKAGCEKRLKFYDRFYETLKSAHHQQPFESSILDDLLEAHYYFKASDRVLVAISKFSSEPLSVRQRTVYGVSLAEQGRVSEALPVLQTLVEREKLSGVRPVVLFMLGKMFSEKAHSGAEANSYLSRFLMILTRPDNLLIEGWDPYRTSEKVEEAKKILDTMRSG